MMKKNTRRFTNEAAIMLHAEANKSDPFAARRMATTLRNGYEKPNDVAADALHVIALRRERIEAEFTVWKAMHRTPAAYSYTVCLNKSTRAKMAIAA